MSHLTNRLPLGRALALIDLVLVVWTVSWIIVGMQVSHEVDGLTRLSGTVVKVGEAIDASGDTIGSLSGIPVVGDRVSEPADRLRQAGASALSSGRSSRESIHDLSPLLGFAIALIPTVPLLALYLPLRVAAVRERRSIERLIRSHHGDPRLERLLAQRALAHLSYRDLAAATLDSAAADAHGSTQRLAAAELARMGIDTSRARP